VLLRDILRTHLDQARDRFGNLRILETGTIRNEDPQYAADDGWSTVHIAEWCVGADADEGRGGTRGHLDSIDLDTSVANRVLEARGLRRAVALVEDHSIHALGAMLLRAEIYRPPTIHVAYLDSDNDPSLILHEYLLVTQMMPSGGIVMVDDVDLSGQAVGYGARKGHEIAPWLSARGIEYTLTTRTGQGYSTGVLVTRIP
jgi:hypothetical protein